MSNIVILAESGSDIPVAKAAENGIVIVPMHVTMGSATIDDGSLPPAEMLEECRQLGVLPKTSGCMPADFAKAFDQIHAEQPEAKILYVAYSSVTTCSYESARTAAEGRDYVYMLDTTHVSIGQGIIVMQTAKHLAENPDISVDELRDYALDLSSRTRMGFIPGDLGYLRAGGRLSNVAFLGATLLRIKPIIELIGGRLVATQKLRGSMEKAAIGLMDHMASQGDYEKDLVFFVRSPGLPVSVMQAVEAHAAELGFAEWQWYDTQNVITSHCGPGSYAIAFIGKK